MRRRQGWISRRDLDLLLLFTFGAHSLPDEIAHRIAAQADRQREFAANLNRALERRQLADARSPQIPKVEFLDA